MPNNAELYLPSAFQTERQPDRHSYTDTQTHMSTVITPINTTPFGVTGRKIFECLIF